MQLPIQEGMLFYKLHFALMHFVCGRVPVLEKPTASVEEYMQLDPQDRYLVHEAYRGRTDLIDAFIAENPQQFSAEEREIVSSWRHMVFGKFYFHRQMAKHAIFLSTDNPMIAYGVVALADPFPTMFRRPPPVLLEATLLPFKDRIIYDSILSPHSVILGPGIRRSLEEDFKREKATRGIVTSLPAFQGPPIAIKPKPAPKKREKAAATEIGREIIELVDRFCREELNEEYADLCRKMAEKLAGKRPSPLISGKPNTWACGIVRTIGWVNFLDDREQHPHMKLTAIDKAFGVGQSTGQGKSSLIRKLLKIRHFDAEWTLPSRMESNPMIWMIQVNGFMMDARSAPREVQEIAFEKGLIPYMPADRESGEA